jgi:hypothetical protein
MQVRVGVHAHPRALAREKLYCSEAPGAPPLPVFSAHDGKVVAAQSGGISPLV